MIVIGRHKDIVFDATLDSAMRNIESIIGIVTEINLLIFFLHARKVSFDPLLTEFDLSIAFCRFVVR